MASWKTATSATARPPLGAIERRASERANRGAPNASRETGRRRRSWPSDPRPEISVGTGNVARRLTGTGSSYGLASPTRSPGHFVRQTASPRTATTPRSRPRTRTRLTARALGGPASSAVSATLAATTNRLSDPLRIRRCAGTATCAPPRSGSVAGGMPSRVSAETCGGARIRPRVCLDSRQRCSPGKHPDEPATPHPWRARASATMC